MGATSLEICARDAVWDGPALTAKIRLLHDDMQLHSLNARGLQYLSPRRSRASRDGGGRRTSLEINKA